MISIVPRQDELKERRPRHPPPPHPLPSLRVCVPGCPVHSRWFTESVTGGVNSFKETWFLVSALLIPGYVTATKMHHLIYPQLPCMLMEKMTAITQLLHFISWLLKWVQICFELQSPSLKHDASLHISRSVSAGITFTHTSALHIKAEVKQVDLEFPRGTWNPSTSSGLTCALCGLHRWFPKGLPHLCEWSLLQFRNHLWLLFLCHLLFPIYSSPVLSALLSKHISHPPPATCVALDHSHQLLWTPHCHPFIFHTGARVTFQK